MIPAPKRSVTRFFIPLIDVLILLFCIFLLMPYVTPEEASAASNSTPAAKADPSDPIQMQKELDRLRREHERLQKERDRAVKSQIVTVLEIDGESGRLYHRGVERREIADQAAAFALIDRQQRLAAGREVYFLILYPRELTGFPEQRQVAAFERWFATVPHGYDNPRGRMPGRALMSLATFNLMDNLGRMVQGGLAVLGAAALGAFAVGYLVNLTTRLVAGRGTPVFMLRWIRLLGAVASALAVGYLVFSGAGGWGLGGGFGPGTTGSGVTPSDKSSLTSNPANASVSGDATVARLGVTLLGGKRVVAERFYLPDGQSNPRTLADLQALLKSAPTTAAQPGFLTLRIYDDSVDQSHPAVVELEAWARDYHWRVAVEKVPGPMPATTGGKS